MLRKPSRKNFKYKFQRPNLIPVLDAVFIFIFFLLFSADFVNLFEINSNVPIVSSAPPSKTIPLNLTLKVTNNKLTLYKGINRRFVRSFNISKDNLDLNPLHQALIKIKKNNLSERTIILEPSKSVDYEMIVRIMDEVMLLRRTDEALFTKDKSGIDVRIKYLFDDIIFGNIKS